MNLLNLPPARLLKTLLARARMFRPYAERLKFEPYIKAVDLEEVQLCIVHMVRNSLRYVNWKERKAVAQDLRAIYTAATAEAAADALEAFEEKWDERFPTISRSWRTRWEHLTPFFAYPPEIRNVIYTTNAIESMQASLRKVTRKRGSFPTEESVRKVLYLAMDKIARRWSRPIKDWPAVLNHFAIVFEGRITLE